MEYALFFILNVVISTITLVVSMFIFSYFFSSGFGEAKQAILKGAGLIIVVNLLSFIPVLCLNLLIILTVWVVGLMVLFDLQWWEAICLALINWGVNVVTAIVLAGIILTAARTAEEISLLTVVLGFLA